MRSSTITGILVIGFTVCVLVSVFYPLLEHSERPTPEMQGMEGLEVGSEEWNLHFFDPHWPKRNAELSMPAVLKLYNVRLVLVGTDEFGQEWSIDPTDQDLGTYMALETDEVLLNGKFHLYGDHLLMFDTSGDPFSDARFQKSKRNDVRYNRENGSPEQQNRRILDQEQETNP